MAPPCDELQRVVDDDGELRVLEDGYTVYDVVTGRQLDGRNLLHLRRFLGGRSRSLALCAQRAVASGSPSPSLLELDVDMVMV